MRTLVTGSSGMVGRLVVERLRAVGRELVPFDLAEDHDIRSDDDMARGLDGVIHVVHPAAVLGWHGETAEDHVAVNLLGAWRLLDRSVRAGVSRVVFAEVLGRPGATG